jgi:hypothetical protein
MFVRSSQVDAMLSDLSLDELLGFLPLEADFDSYTHAVAEVDVFRAMASDPTLLEQDADFFVDAPSFVLPESAYDSLLPQEPSQTDDSPEEGVLDPAIVQLSCLLSDTILVPNTSEDQWTNFLSVMAYWSHAKIQMSEHDLHNLKPYFGWIPVETIKKTIENTTQLAKAVNNYPMIRHLTARFRILKRFRLGEYVSTDPIFANVAGLLGYSVLQVFYGLSSHCIDVYGMKSKAEFPQIYKDFLKDVGVPDGLLRDKAPEEDSREIQAINREYHIKDKFAEPGYPNQNPVESMAIRWLKKASERLMNHTAAPDFVFVYAMQYLALVNNWTADPTLQWKTPYEKRFGVTPDISALLCFHFYEKVYYLDTEAKFPSSKERAGRWLGVAHNIGDALTFYILDEEKQTVVARSVVRSARSMGANKRVLFDPNLDREVADSLEDQPVQTPVHLQLSDKELKVRQRHKRKYKKRTGNPYLS